MTLGGFVIYCFYKRLIETNKECDSIESTNKPFKMPYQGTNNRDSAGAERLLLFSEQPLLEQYIGE